MSRDIIFKFFLDFFFFFYNFHNISSLFQKELKTSINSYGVPGIIDMPTAGSFSDGELGF